MDAKSIGRRIEKLRKKRGLTQLALSEKLNISNKTISKWESGAGFPDITAFPQLAAVFGVSVDYLMSGTKKGIAIAGNIIADIVKQIDTYPKPGMLANVSDITLAVGGCVPNTAIGLTHIDPSLPVQAFGKIGTDENGRYIVSQLVRNGVQVEGISYSSQTPTSFCDVFSMPTGERTFFHKKGANAEFSPDDMDLDALECDILHIGYLLLLDRFDAPDPEYGTVMARFLHNVQQRGIRTSIDVVSDSSADYGKVILPALKYCDYAIMNELEACRVFGLEPYDSQGHLNRSILEDTMKKMVQCGVREKVILHTRHISFLLNAKSGIVSAIPSLMLPPEVIKGNVGAGDAFCAGCLYGIGRHFSDPQILSFASAAAACSLMALNSVDGMRSYDEILAISKQYPRYPL